MNIYTEFNIGDEVYIIPDDEKICIKKEKISSIRICVSARGGCEVYYGAAECEHFIYRSDNVFASVEQAKNYLKNKIEKLKINQEEK